MSSQAPIPRIRRTRRPRETDRVPVLPPGVSFLIQALADDSLSFGELASAVEQVPSVAARLLALANSAWSAPVVPVTSIEAACSRLGLRIVRTASIALAVSQPFNPARCPPFNAVTFWSSALLNAEAAGWIAERVGGSDVATARTAGLLSNLGLVWLAEAMPEQTATALSMAEAVPAAGSVNRHLVMECGLGYDEAGALLAEAWHLPNPLRIAIGQQFRDDLDSPVLTRILRGATRVVGHTRRAEEWCEADPGLSSLGMDMSTQLAATAYVTAQCARTAILADTLFT